MANQGQRMKFDEAILTVYAWESNLGDDEILEKLLSLNLESSNQVTVTFKVTVT